ncbi:MAG TPA: hypothetical protein VFW90_01650, partial [Candidatus Saccharimonadales bacterium]|nr:hypothetical protein [Candidatus Saccharimonadales bacterium]
MARKFIGLGMGIILVSILIQSIIYPAYPMFSITSPNLAVNIVSILMSAAVIWLSFKKRFKS